MPGVLDPYMATLPSTQAVMPEQEKPSAYGSLLGGLSPRKLDVIKQQLATLPAIDLGWYKPLLVKSGKNRLRESRKKRPKRKKPGPKKVGDAGKGTRDPGRGASGYGGSY